MNPIYHALSGYKNWQSYIKMASLETSYAESSGNSLYGKVVTRMTFYYDGAFAKMRQEVRTVQSTTAGPHYVVKEVLKATAKTQHEKNQEYLKEVQSLPECSPTDSLLTEAKECLLLDNPPRTGLLLVKLVEGWEEK